MTALVLKKQLKDEMLVDLVNAQIAEAMASPAEAMASARSASSQLRGWNTSAGVRRCQLEKCSWHSALQRYW